MAAKTAGILSELATAPGRGPGRRDRHGTEHHARRGRSPGRDGHVAQLAGAEAPDRTALAIAYLRHLDAGLTAWTDDPVAARADYLAACVTVGQEVTVSLPADEVLRGTAVDVDAEGRIVVQDATGKRHVLSAGDVTHLRPA